MQTKLYFEQWTKHRKHTRRTKNTLASKLSIEKQARVLADLSLVVQFMNQSAEDDFDDFDDEDFDDEEFEDEKEEGKGKGCCGQDHK